MLARAESADQRTAIFAALQRRNRMVAILRIGLPVLGALVLLGLVMRIVVATLLNQFGISNITIDRGNLVVETPSYSGVSANGTMYTISSEGARAALGSLDAIALTGAALSMTNPGGSAITARAAEALLQTNDQLVTVTGATQITSNGGMAGTIMGLRADMLRQTMASDGAVDVRFRNGTTLRASTMTYDSETEAWVFHGAVLDLPATPGEEPFPAPAETTP